MVGGQNSYSKDLSQSVARKVALYSNLSRCVALICWAGYGFTRDAGIVVYIAYYWSVVFLKACYRKFSFERDRIQKCKNHRMISGSSLTVLPAARIFGLRLHDSHHNYSPRKITGRMLLRSSRFFTFTIMASHLPLLDVVLSRHAGFFVFARSSS